MPELEQQLADLAAAVSWPATPQLAGRIRARISAPPRPWYKGRWAIAAAAVAVAGAALLAYPPSRDVVAGWLNLHVLIERVTHPPSPSPLTSGPLGKRLGLGSPTTLSDARPKVSWRIAIPSQLGRPDEVYLQTTGEAPSQGEVTLVYSARPGIPVSGQTGVGVLITEARGTVDQNFFGKVIGNGTTLEDVSVGGHQGYWISGQPNVFFFVDAAGNFRNETMRLATNTLILDYGGTIVRIEGDLTKEQALQIAASLS